MRYCFYFFIVLICSSNSVAQVFDVATIKYAGDDSKRINLVILGDGYQSSELDKFVTDATNFSNEMFSQSPFAEYSNYFNVYAIKVPSNESGADHPGSALDVLEPDSPVTEVDTYFNTTFDGFNFHRLLFYGIDGHSASQNLLKINAVLADNFPTYDQALILVNSDVYGGSGGTFAISSLAPSANEIALHELGHSLFDLKDEYYPGDLRLNESINATQEHAPDVVKWKNWLNTNNVGVYPYGTSGEAATWYRPHQNCKMRYLERPFCSVCKEGMIEKIHDLVPAIEDYSPNTLTLNNPALPVAFNLSLVLPIPNTLTTVWTLNGTDFATDTPSVTLTDTSIEEGENTLTAIVTDETAMLRIDDHATIHINTVSWRITNSTLRINSIDSESNTYNISLFPNPSTDRLNLKFESKRTPTLSVKISSIDGKLVQKTTLSNLKSKAINISKLATGLYNISFYDGVTLLASRKFIKN